MEINVATAVFQVFYVFFSWEFQGPLPALMPRVPQEIAGFIKGLIAIIVPE